jgi:hypothetical protein
MRALALGLVLVIVESGAGTWKDGPPARCLPLAPMPIAYTSSADPMPVSRGGGGVAGPMPVAVTNVCSQRWTR